MRMDIPRYRLYNQRLSATTFKTPHEVARWLCAIQAQDYAGAKWAIAQRMLDATDSTLDRAFADGSILRSHLLRPTWHFAAPEDIRWLLALTAPRVHAMNAFMYRKLEVDRTVARKSYSILEKVLREDKQRTREELGVVLQKAGIAATGQRLGYIMMSAELDGILCSGARRGKQFTYALLEERVPQIKAISRERALAELTTRYFSTRGPATVQDFAWWSGLTMTDAKSGIEMVKSQFVNEMIQNQQYWFDDSISPTENKSPTAYLLPNYDEYFIGFKDRSSIGKFATKANIAADHSSLIANIIILNGQIVGGWKRTLNKDNILVETSLITKLNRAEKQAVADAADRFGRFLGLPVSVTHPS